MLVLGKRECEYLETKIHVGLTDNHTLRNNGSRDPSNENTIIISRSKRKEILMKA